MSFTVNDLQDLLQLLAQHPDWRDAVRRQVLTDELLALPDSTRQVEAHIDARLEELIEAQKRTEARLQELAEAQKRTEARLQELIEAQKRTESRLGRLEGWALEARYRDRGTAYFGSLIHRGRVLDSSRVSDLVEDAVDEGRLTPREREELLLADIVMAGRRPDDRAEVYLLADVSVGIEPSDVERAADRAAILERLGRPVLLVVAGEQISGSAVALARQRGVRQVVDGAILA